MMHDFVEVEVVGGENAISITAFRFLEHVYVIATSDIRPVLQMQADMDRICGHHGLLLPYETMLFRGIMGEESDTLFPFGGLPGHRGLGVFQRYATEDEARDEHQMFVTRVKKVLRAENEAKI